MRPVLPAILTLLMVSTALPSAQADHLGSMTGAFVSADGLQVTVRWTIHLTGLCCSGSINFQTGDGASGSAPEGVSNGAYVGDGSGTGSLSGGRTFTWVRTRPADIVIDVTFTYLSPGSYNVAWNNCCASFSGTIPVTTGSTATPSAPRDLAADVAAPHTVTLTWTAPAFLGTPALTEYRVYRDHVLVGSVEASTLTFADGPLASPGTFEYDAVAFNGVEGPHPGHVTATILAPTKPRELTARFDLFSQSNVLTWQAPADAGTGALTAYAIARASLNEPWHEIGTTPPDQRSFKDVDVVVGVTYTYVVAARNPFEGPVSEPASSDTRPTVVTTGMLEFHGAATLPQFPCNQPRCYGGTFAGAVSGSLTGVYEEQEFDVAFSTLLAPTAGGGVEAAFDYGEFACLAGQQSVLGDASGSGTITVRPGQVTGRWSVPGEQPAIPHSVTEIRASFTFTWARAATGAVLQLDTLRVDMDVAGLGTRTVIDSPGVPNVGAANFVPHASGTLPACTTPTSIQGEIAGSATLHS